MAGVKKGVTVLDRFWSRIWVDKVTGCWLWLGKLGNTGYPVITCEGRRYLAHRWAYQWFIGPLRDDQHAHHTCGTPRCANPYHIRPVSPYEHCLLTPRSLAHKRMFQTHCKRGHEFTPENTIPVKKNGRRECRICHNHNAYLHMHPEMTRSELPLRRRQRHGNPNRHGK